MKTLQPATDPRAWDAATAGPPAAWYFPLSDACLAALEPALRELRDPGRAVTDLAVTDEQRAACHDCLEPVRAALETGRGFAILDRIPLERYPPREATALYWLIGQLLGQPFEQNVQGTLLYDVRDTGQDVRYGARFSVTNAESTFHTDNSFGDTVLDYVGLLVLRTAKSGGLSQLVSGHAVCRELEERRPDVLEVLSRPFHVERRGGVKDGQAPTARFPVVARHRGDVRFRYLRYWIETGHERAGEPLTAEQVEALDVLDGVLSERRLRVEFALRPGEALFVNNRWLLHNRTGFEDHTEPELRRHLVRLWLQAPAD
ncbi:MAG TPA: TauD/TfdA family dioxygenase [Gemmataceae bacterium]|nr:TauD/TfdA family dioxygenase [Gemmataceae bacterium]